MIDQLVNWVTLTPEGIASFYFGIAATAFGMGIKIKAIKVTLNHAAH